MHTCLAAAISVAINPEKPPFTNIMEFITVRSLLEKNSNIARELVLLMAQRSLSIGEGQVVAVVDKGEQEPRNKRYRWLKLQGVGFIPQHHLEALTDYGVTSGYQGVDNLSGYLSKQGFNDNLIGIGENIIFGTTTKMSRAGRYHAINFQIRNGTWHVCDNVKDPIDLNGSSPEKLAFMEQYVNIRLFQIEEVGQTSKDENDAYSFTTMTPKLF